MVTGRGNAEIETLGAASLLETFLSLKQKLERGPVSSVQPQLKTCWQRIRKHV